MTLKNKLLLIITLIAILSAATAITTIAYLSLSHKTKDTLKKAESDLTAKRVLITAELQNYIGNIEKQAIVMANDVSIKEATKEFTSAFNQFNTDLADTSSLNNYYNSEFKSVYDSQNTKSISVSKLYNSLPPITKALQSQFIALNPNPLGEKDKLDSLGDNSEYDIAHKRYHPTVRKFQQEFGYYDVFIVEPTNGNIVYSVFKELDYATSLKNGPYRQSGIAEAFNAALTLSDGDTYLTDFAAYLPSYDNAASFISSPIYDKGSLIGVLIFQMPIDVINSLMTLKGKWTDSGFGQSGEIYLVGKDYTLRNESRFFEEDKAGYLKLVKSVGMKEASNIANKDTTISIQPVNTKGVAKALAGETGFDIFNDYREVSVLSSYAPVKVGNHTWAIMSEIDEEEAMMSVTKLTNYIYGVGVSILAGTSLLSLLVAFQLSISLIKPLNILANKFTDLSEGEADLTVRLEQTNTPEINRIVFGFNSFIDGIGNTFSSVKGSVSRIASSGTELGVTTEQTSATLKEQELSIDKVKESVQQFSRSISEVSEQTTSAMTQANQAKDQTAENSERASLAVENIKHLVAEVNSSSETIKELQSSVQDIRDVLSVINGIAEQTNLLALNAAIEAARAGEQGRGFAVVADEVRSLASRTQESTVIIQTQINKLIEVTKMSSDSMERASISAEGGIHLVEVVNESLTELQTIIINLSNMSSEIASASQMQGYTIDFITESVNELSSRAHEITESSTHISGVSNELSSVAETLKNDTDRFKV